MKIAIFPYNSDSPIEYINLMVYAYKLAYPGVEFCEFPTFKTLNDTINDFDVVWFNWFENMPNDSKDVLRDFVSKILKIRILKKHNKRIIATFHNIRPHEVKLEFLNKLFFKWYLKQVDNIIILCEESRKYLAELIGKDNLDKVVLVPHPAYKLTPLKYLSESQKLPFSVLFFGLLRPYKNVEMLISLAKENPDIRFTIAGQPITKEYGEYLSDLSKGLTNVTMDLRFLSDNDLDKLMEHSSILLLPYNTKSSLNSGVLFYALTKGINVIIPEIGGVKDIHERNRIYTYKYSDESEHKDAISKILKKAKSDYDNDYNRFIESSKILRQEITSDHSVDNIAKHLSKLNL